MTATVNPMFPFFVRRTACGMSINQPTDFGRRNSASRPTGSFRRIMTATVKPTLPIYRDGVWWILQSSDNSVKVTQWGIAEDKPQAGDFDGDGKDDLAVFRPSTGVWYILRSSDNGFVANQWGLSSDIPQSADYDGDGQNRYRGLSPVKRCLVCAEKFRRKFVSPIRCERR